MPGAVLLAARGSCRSVAELRAASCWELWAWSLDVACSRRGRCGSPGKGVAGWGQGWGRWVTGCWRVAAALGLRVRACAPATGLSTQWVIIDSTILLLKVSGCKYEYG